MDLITTDVESVDDRESLTAEEVHGGDFVHVNMDLLQTLTIHQNSRNLRQIVAVKHDVPQRWKWIERQIFGLIFIERLEAVFLEF